MLACLALLAGACTTVSTGAPVPQGAASSSGTAPRPSTTSIGSAATTGIKSRRPEQLVLADVQPCGLLTAGQQQRFGVDRPPRITDAPALKAPSCNFLSFEQGIVISISPMTSFGIDRFQPGQVNGEVRPLTVRAFPAVEVFTETSERSDMFCVVVVDVADGQAVHVNYSEAGVRPHLGRNVVCDRAAQVADVVIENLLAR
ncbi:DUF3558 domain-containing protein [Kibdelosporangium persicum]|uniref:DUF3558 domain-containing protein n=1 Tax=Kibdelosporangium persicum TaxID=2698649 RepID=UPI0028A5855F|nr:DUF3558 domain-containing protein [Kibdelosporangium persicum]